MDPEQIREYGQLHDEVVRKLRHHAYIDDRNIWHVFQYLALPSFTSPIAWDVFQRRRKDQPEEHVLIRSKRRINQRLGAEIIEEKSYPMADSFPAPP